MGSHFYTSQTLSVLPVLWKLALSSMGNPAFTPASSSYNLWLLQPPWVGPWHDFHHTCCDFTTQVHPNQTHESYGSCYCFGLHKKYYTMKHGIRLPPRSCLKGLGNIPCKYRWVYSPVEWTWPTKGDWKLLANISLSLSTKCSKVSWSHTDYLEDPCPPPPPCNGAAHHSFL